MLPRVSRVRRRHLADYPPNKFWHLQSATVRLLWNNDARGWHTRPTLLPKVPAKADYRGDKTMKIICLACGGKGDGLVKIRHKWNCPMKQRPSKPSAEKES